MKKTNTKYLLVGLIISCLILSSCVVLPPADTSPPQTYTTPTENGWTPPPTESQTPILPSIADVVAKVKPSVVAINVKVTIDTLFGPSTQEGAGSGWIIDSNGIIVTNNHVVEEADSITVTLDNGQTFPVAMNTVATDALSDLAILRIDAENLPAVTVGDSEELRVGDWVVAIGNALGEGISATNGIVSRRDVQISVSAGQMLNNLIQTNAAINPGNSGGPLVNMAGEVIGITSAKLSAVGIEGMGYAISTKEAMPIIEQLINTGRVIRPYLGVAYTDVNPYLVWRYNLTVEEGIFVTDVLAGYPAAQAGIKAGDVIISFNSQEIANTGDFISVITSCQIGQKVEITYWRGSSKFTTYATLVESPPP